MQGDGRQTRDFTYVGTVTALITDAIARRVTYPEPVNLAFGTRTEILELAPHGRGARRHARSRSSTPKPGSATCGTHRTTPTRLRELFPDVVPADLRDSLRATLDWFRAGA